MLLEKLRFVVAGGSTTAFSYALYAGLLYFGVAAGTAYAAAYVAGIGWSYAINSRWVFRTPMSLGGFLKFPLVYVLQAIASFALFHLLHGVLRIDSLLVPLLVMAITIPITYLATRFVLTRQRSGKRPGQTPRA